MGKLIIYDNPNPAALELERAQRFRDLPFEEKLKMLFSLIRLSVAMNGGKPLKQPQGKGIVIRKPGQHGSL